MSAMTEYERQRDEIIRRNRAKLAELGIKLASERLRALAPPAAAPKPRAAVAADRKRAREAAAAAGPERRSARVRKARGEVLEGEEAELVELEEDEPRAQGVRKSGDRVGGQVGASRAGLSWEERLAEVKLDHLIDLSSDDAKFVILGSAGKHYVVTLSDERHTCQCMDFRTRGKQRPCKHIRVSQQELGLEQGALKGGGWRAAVEATLKEDLDRLNADQEAVAA